MSSAAGPPRRPELSRSGSPGSSETRDWVPDGSEEALEVPEHSIVVVDCKQPAGTTWRKFKCAEAGGGPRGVHPLWYRTQDGGDRRIHARDEVQAPRKIDEKTMILGGGRACFGSCTIL